MDAERIKNLILNDFCGEFDTFKTLLKEYNSRFNLTAICDDEGIFYKHFLDSACGEELFPLNASVCEVGSGGGFPSIPLKIIRRDLEFTLIESTGKKCEFLRLVVDKLGFSGVQVKNIRAEDGARDKSLREKFDVCCARAVAPLNILAEYCLPFVKPGGLFIAYKGECSNELEGAKRAFEVLGGRLERAVCYDLEGCGNRTLVVVKKIKNTPPQYPRGQGRERKNPL